ELPGRAEIRDRVEAMWNHPRRSVPWRRGERWFQLRNDGLQDQDVLWTAVAGDPADPAAPSDDRWEVLLDPNELSEDGTVSLTGTAVTDDGALVAYALSEAGSDWRTWHVREVATGEDRPDEVRWSKFAPAAWLPDGSGFLYGAYDPPEEGREFEATNQGMRLMLHRLGDDPDDDTVVYERPDQPRWGFVPEITHDDRWLVITVWEGTERETRIHLAPLDDERIGEVRPLLDAGDAQYFFLGLVGEHAWFQTDLAAPNGRVVAVHLDGTDDPVEVLTESEHRLNESHLVGGADGTDAYLVTGHLEHAISRVRVHGPLGGGPPTPLDPDDAHEVALPDVGSAGDPHGRGAGFAGGRRDRAFHLAFETFTAPIRILRHDLEDHTTVEAFPPGLAAPDDLVTEQVFVEHDGVRVPLFLIHRDDVDPTGDVPTVLWGYGGFDIPIVPQWRTQWRVWVELGGLLAVACLRGGGEYGKDWHDAGRLANKQHVFDDAIACAEWLTGEGGWTNTDQIGIEGRSNGGLLVGACLTQRPDLFGCAVPEVGVLDMLRFHEFTIGWGWVSDYGSADDPEQFEWLLAYSPYHNLEEGACYPPTLVTTGDHDDRVVPGHSFKFAAALQHAQGCDHPVVIRIDTSAGHGAGKPIGKLIDERADVIAFEAHHTGLS
ncbi:MAG: prolyl oligopeptidase family serine peptidase, partial [Nitriliruptorales bacterium]|nr:prolyl oligopeptidase family serine peptidase [Nitriliruptorales bacterium]